MSTHRTTPQQISTMPPGIPYIIGNEWAERFSFYGMKAILYVFLTDHLLSASGALAAMSEERAKAILHSFVTAAYFFPLVGALISDIFLGKYLTILTLSLLYCLGHGSLALMDIAPHIDMGMRPFLYAGLLMIAMGAGAIKPCVSAHVGDQFGTQNKHLLSKVFSWFYFSINFGSAISTLLTPWLLNEYGPWLAFGLPGVLMAIATFVFWLGRNKFVHVPPAGWKNFKNEVLSKDGLGAVLNLAPIFLIFIPVFWALFDQSASAWVEQAKFMDREVMGTTLLPSQIQAVNPFFILALIPVFTYLVYPYISKIFPLSPLRKISIGLFITGLAFVITSLIEQSIVDNAAEAAKKMWSVIGMEGPASYDGLKAANREANEMIRALADDPAAQEALQAQLNGTLSNMPTIAWQFLAYFVLTSAEIMVSITALEFAYTQAPKRIKSFIMGIFLAGVAMGNAFTAGVNFFIENPDTENVLVLNEDGTGTFAIADTSVESLSWNVADDQLVLQIDNSESKYDLEDVAAGGFTYSSVGETLEWSRDTDESETLDEEESVTEIQPEDYEESLVGEWKTTIDGGSKLEGASYYWFFTIIMFVGAIIFVFYAMLYKGKTHIQGEAADDASMSEPELAGPEGQHGQDSN